MIRTDTASTLKRHCLDWMPKVEHTSQAIVIGSATYIASQNTTMKKMTIRLFYPKDRRGGNRADPPTPTAE